MENIYKIAKIMTKKQFMSSSKCTLFCPCEYGLEEECLDGDIYETCPKCWETSLKQSDIRFKGENMNKRV